MHGIRDLLRAVIDYAGLFPPAGLPLSDVVDHYHHYRRSLERWMLGRLIIPLKQLDAAAEWARRLVDQGDPWPISCLVPPLNGAGEDWQAAMRTVAGFNATHGELARIESIECRVDDCGLIGEFAGAVPEGLEVYWELPLNERLSALVREISVLNHPLQRAKIRTGGIVADALPSPHDVARFMRLCGDLRLGWKATAGLHHALRGSYRLTYEPESPCATMFGFLNVLLAAALEWHFRPAEDVVISLLTESQSEALEWSPDGVRWRDWEWDHNQIAVARRDFAISFGSCSFREPVEELQQLGWIELPGRRGAETET